MRNPAAKVQEMGLQPGMYHRGLPQDAFRRVGLGGWLIQRDSSVHFRGGNVVPMEITSPVMSGADGVDQTIRMVNLIKSWGGKVNMSCGLHVTVGHARFKEDAVLCQLILSMYRFSDATVAVGSSFGRRSRGYSMSLIRKYGVNVNRKQDGDAQFARRFSLHRYQSLNLTNAKTLAPRVEFRLFAGTLNTNRMLAAIWTSLGICQYAMTVSRLDKAVRSGAEYANASYYRKNVDYMMKWLGWTVDKTGHAAFASKMGVMLPASLPANTYDKVVAQIRKDAKRMDDANREVGYTARVARPERLSQPRRAVVREGAPSPTGEGE